MAALPRPLRTTDSRHSFPIAPNRIGKDFAASAPNQVWLADFTYVPTGEGWLNLAALLDMHTRKNVDGAMRETLHAGIAVEALKMAIKCQRPAPGVRGGTRTNGACPHSSTRIAASDTRPTRIAKSSRLQE